MLDQELLKRLLVISQLGSFAKAAGKLHVSRQALVEQVAALEKQLCFPIFLRTNRGTRLSRAGEIYLQNTMKLEASYDELLRRCRETTEGVQSVTIGSLPNLPGVSLPIICQKFHKYYPGVQLHFRDFSLPLYFEQFQQGLFDVTAEYIMNYYHPACDLEFLPLAKVRQHIGVLRDSPLANKRFIDVPGRHRPVGGSAAGLYTETRAGYLHRGHRQLRQLASYQMPHVRRGYAFVYHGKLPCFPEPAGSLEHPHRTGNRLPQESASRRELSPYPGGRTLPERGQGHRMKQAKNPCSLFQYAHGKTRRRYCKNRTEMKRENRRDVLRKKSAGVPRPTDFFVTFFQNRRKQT